MFWLDFNFIQMCSLSHHRRKTISSDSKELMLLSFWQPTCTEKVSTSHALHVLYQYFSRTTVMLLKKLIFKTNYVNLFEKRQFEPM